MALAPYLIGTLKTLGRAVPTVGSYVILTAVAAAAVLWWQSRTIVLEDVLLPPLEHRFQRPELGDPSRLSGIISVGGSHYRIEEAARLARGMPHARLILVGVNKDEYIREFVTPWISRDRVTIESQSTTTYEDATFAAAVAKPTPGQRWVLVTSAYHMPRAVGAFRRAGFTVVPWPVNDPVLDPRRARFALHEWLGLVAYWIMGRSSALFPGP
jgi:uncharacterized SAM-binding protein YcdF (DUF218 family)